MRHSWGLLLQALCVYRLIGLTPPPGPSEMPIQKTTLKWFRLVSVRLPPLGPSVSIPTEIGNASPDPLVKPSRELVHPEEGTLTAGALTLRPKLPVNESTLVPVGPR